MKKYQQCRITGVSNLTDTRVAISPPLSLPLAMDTYLKCVEAYDTSDGRAYREIRIEPIQPEELFLNF